MMSDKTAGSDTFGPAQGAVTPDSWLAVGTRVSYEEGQGVVMNYIWDDSCLRKIGYWISPNGDYFAENWVEVLGSRVQALGGGEGEKGAQRGRHA